MTHEHDLAYLAERVRKCLIGDERAHALDIEVTPKDGCLVLSGQVSCESRRRDIGAVARECARQSSVRVVNRIAVVHLDGTIAREFVE
jgi:hypothetical protein